MSEENRVKPCPWCGRDGAEFLWYGRDGAVRLGDGTGVFICGCGTEGPWGADEADALAKWNTRPLESGLFAEVRRLRADTERLDWVEANEATVGRTNDGGWYVGFGDPDSPTATFGDSIRDAIDRSMRGESDG